MMYFVDGGTVMTENEKWLDEHGLRLVECYYCKDVFIPVDKYQYRSFIVYSCKECKSKEDHKQLITKLKDIGYSLGGAFLVISLLIGLTLLAAWLHP